MIDSTAWQTVLSTATDISTVAEFYSSDAVPGDDGFDPNDALNCYAAVDGISYMGVDYSRLVTAFGSIKRTTGKDANTASVTFSNVSRVISAFELGDIGFEGLVMVIRVISRSLSDSLEKSQILFAGRCDKPTSGNKDSLQVTATWILGGPDIQIPYRKYTVDDDKGRVQSDPDFEGFPSLPTSGGVITYPVREKRGGLLGLFGFKKTVQKTLPWSSVSDLDANKAVPEVLGESQLLSTHIGYADVGTYIKIKTAFCQGEIYALNNVRSTDSRITLDPVSFAPVMGKRGASNGPDDPNWVAPGLYSRTALVRCQGNNSALDETDPAPDIAGVVVGRLMTIPAAGVWSNTGQWTDNPSAHTRWLLTTSDYCDIDESWMEDDDFTDAYGFCNELIVQQSASDQITQVAG